MEKNGIITKINTSDWGSPLVVVPKADGRFRMCVDYKVGVNPQLEEAHHPIPKIENALNKLRDSKYFCTLDLYNAYHHVEVDEGSARIQAISTHKGTFQVNRLSQGIKTAPSEFNRILEQILEGLEGVSSYFDDIVVHADTYEKCRARLIACFERLQKYDLHLNEAKCKLFETSIKYLGFVVENNRILKSREKIEDIIDTPRPTNAKEVQQFLGFVTYYIRFIRDASTKTFPLRQLLQKKTRFEWTKKCEEAFLNIKKEIVSNTVLMSFNPDLPIIVSCDASPVGVAGILSHFVNGVERPVAFVSRALTPVEQNYSQLDREAVAIYWAIKKFFVYLYGTLFTLITDNKPFTRIFKTDSSLPAITSSRLLRYASFLAEFQYQLKHRSANQQTNVDYLSRAPPKRGKNSTELDETDEISVNSINTISTPTLSSDNIRKHTDVDPELSQLKADLLSGKNSEGTFHLYEGIIFRDSRIVIPGKLRAEVLNELHQTHLKISKMKNFARRLRLLEKDR